jgi:TetR/AcrR family transcriptional regulator
MPRRPEQFEAIREKSREKIFSASLELFANKGYDATSIESIAKKAGISKGLIYN